MAMFSKVPHQYFAPNRCRFSQTDGCFTGKMQSMNPVCWFIFLTTKCCKRTTMEDHRHSPAPHKNAVLPASAPVFNHLLLHLCTNKNRLTEAGKLEMQKWTELLLSSSTQNTRRHISCWWFDSVAQDERDSDAHRSPIPAAQCLKWKCKQLWEGGEKEITIVSTEKWQFLLDGPKAELEPLHGL